MQETQKNWGGSAKLTASALAGVLAVGMIPAAAFAEDEAVEVEADAAIELQAGATDVFNNATVVLQSGSTELAVEKKVVTATVAQAKAVLSIKSFTTSDNATIATTAGAGELGDEKSYTVEWKNASNETIGTGVTLPAETITAAGSFKVVITAIDGEYKGGVKEVAFNVVGNKLSDLTLHAYDVDEKGAIKSGDTADESTYSAEPVKLAFATGTSSSDTLLKEGKDYTVKYFNRTDDIETATPLSAAPTDAGKYTALLEGAGDYTNTQTTVAFEIAQFELTDFATQVVINDIYGGKGTPDQPDLVGDSAELAKHFELYYDPAKFKIDVDFDGTETAATGLQRGIAGEYSVVTIRPKVTNGEADPNVTGTLDTATFKKYADAATINYDGKAMDGQELKLDASKTEKLDLDKIVVTDADGEKITSGITTQVQETTDGGKTWGSAATLDSTALTKINGTAGMYKVTTTVTGAAGGKASMVVTTSLGAIDASLINLRLDGKAIDSGDLTVDYDPDRDWAAFTASNGYGKGDGSGETGLSGQIKTKVGSATVTRTLGASTDDGLYLELKNDKGEVVTKATKAGMYDVTIKDKKYELTNNTFKLTIKPITVTDFKLENYEKYTTNNTNALHLDRELDTANSSEDWSAILTAGTVAGKDAKGNAEPTLTLKFAYDKNGDGKVTDGSGTPATDDEWAAAFGTSYLKIVATKDGKTVTQIKDAGTYTIELQLTDAAAKDGNYAVTAKPITIVVAGPMTFVDVPTTNNWASEYIDDVNENAWMKGYDSTHFGPKDNMKRGDVALVLWRMATGEYKAANGSVNNQTGIDTGFSDVPSGKYYAQAIKWAADAGIITGYSGKDAGKFGPEDPVTREQFVLMMARYAKYNNVATTSDGSEMAKKNDPTKVSSWAKDAVAWGVDEGMIGSNGTINPQGKIQRQEIAKMASVFAKAHPGAAKSAKASYEATL